MKNKNDEFLKIHRENEIKIKDLTNKLINVYQRLNDALMDIIRLESEKLNDNTRRKKKFD